MQMKIIRKAVNTSTMLTTFSAAAASIIKSIKCEFIKNKMLPNLLSAALYPLAAILISGRGAELMAAVLASEQGAELMPDYVGMPYESLLISLSSTTFLFFIVPILTALYSLSDSLTESTNNGWRLLLMNSHYVERSIKVKYSVNGFLVFSAYAAYMLILYFMLYSWFSEAGLHTVFIYIGALLLSLLCLLPWLVLLQTLFFILPHVILKVFAGIALVLTNLLVTQSDWWRFYPPSYYIMITQSADRNMNWIMCLVSLGLFVIFFFGCSKLMKPYLRKSII